MNLLEVKYSPDAQATIDESVRLIELYCTTLVNNIKRDYPNESSSTQIQLYIHDAGRARMLQRHSNLMAQLVPISIRVTLEAGERAVTNE